MTPAEIGTRLTALRSALVEKLNEQPFLDPSLYVRDTGQCLITLYQSYTGGHYDLGTLKADTFEEVLDKADAFVAALPDPEERVTREYLRRVAHAVDFATENAIADKYVNPLRGVTCAMTNNLLTDQRS